MRIVEISIFEILKSATHFSFTIKIKINNLSIDGNQSYSKYIDFLSIF